MKLRINVRKLAIGIIGDMLWVQGLVFVDMEERLQDRLAFLTTTMKKNPRDLPCSRESILDGTRRVVEQDERVAETLIAGRKRDTIAFNLANIVNS